MPKHLFYRCTDGTATHTKGKSTLIHAHIWTTDSLYYELRALFRTVVGSKESREVNLRSFSPGPFFHIETEEDYVLMRQKGIIPALAEEKLGYQRLENVLHVDAAPAPLDGGLQEESAVVSSETISQYVSLMKCSLNREELEESTTALLSLVEDVKASTSPSFINLDNPTARNLLWNRVAVRSFLLVAWGWQRVEKAGPKLFLSNSRKLVSFLDVLKVNLHSLSTVLPSNSDIAPTSLENAGESISSGLPLSSALEKSSSEINLLHIHRRCFFCS
eukprot:Lithocolla_globosa_v1_NODE_106_length_6331_cov_39.598311.p3 type:complete len:275 gc:universal NODE_106_length_6331_cov_39.598311:1597-2421(+)